MLFDAYGTPVTGTRGSQTPVPFASLAAAETMFKTGKISKKFLNKARHWWGRAAAVAILTPDQIKLLEATSPAIHIRH